MLTGLWNFLGPVLLIGAFYVLLGFAVRFLLHPPDAGALVAADAGACRCVDAGPSA